MDFSFIIITGPNGAGKTQFLLLYRHEVSSSKNNVIYLDFNSVFLAPGTDRESQPCTELYTYLFDVTKDPLGFLNALVMKRFNFEVFHKENCDVDPLELYNYFIEKSKMKDEKISWEDFLLKNKVKKFANELLDEYRSYNSEIQVLKRELNHILKAINFKYSFDFYPKRYPPDEFVLRDMGNKKVVGKMDEVKLSSGETWILGIIVWQYSIENNLSFPQNKDLCEQRPDEHPRKIIMLLDEPDRNLDPKLCKHFIDIVTKVFIPRGIQVIMTTHRVDTVALAPEKSIFKFKIPFPFNFKDYAGGVEGILSYLLQPIHKLEALFRMTSNLREITNYHHKVFTESSNDAYFYEAIFLSLQNYCLKIRQEIRDGEKDSSGKLDYYWYVNHKAYRILSKRCQLSFYPASTTQGACGGCNEVKKAVMRNQNFHKGLFNQLAIQKPYGIIDNDNKKDHKLQDDDSIVMLKMRHSVENFIYDPFVIISAIKGIRGTTTYTMKDCFGTLSEEVHKFIDNCNIQGEFVSDVQTAANECFKQLIGLDKIEKKTYDKDKIESDMFKKIEKKKWAIDIEEVKDKGSGILNGLFNVDISTMSMEEFLRTTDLKQFNQDTFKNNNTLLDIINPKLIILCRIVEQFKNDAIKHLGVQKIDVILDESKVITIDYPEVFLQWRGHNICLPFEDPSETESQKLRDRDRSTFLDALLDNIYNCERLFIPLDLAEVFFDLNNKLLTHVRRTIGKGEVPDAKYSK